MQSPTQLQVVLQLIEAKSDTQRQLVHLPFEQRPRHAIDLVNALRATSRVRAGWMST